MNGYTNCGTRTIFFTKKKKKRHKTTWMNLQGIVLSAKANFKGYILYDSFSKWQDYGDAEQSSGSQ